MTRRNFFKTVGKRLFGTFGAIYIGKEFIKVSHKETVAHEEKVDVACPDGSFVGVALENCKAGDFLTVSMSGNFIKAN